MTLVLCLPLIRPRKANFTAREDLNKTVFKDRMAEIQRERDLGLIDDQELAKLEIELKKSLLTDIKEDVINVSSSKGMKAAYLGMLLLIPVGAIVLYATLSDWEEVSEWHALQGKNQAFENSDRKDTQWLSELTNQDLILLLRTRLHNNPADTRGWMIFAQTLAQLGATKESMTAIEKAVETDPANISLLLNAAQMSVQLKQQEAVEYARRLVDAALSLEPNHEGAQAVSGFIYRQLGQYQRAITTWENLLEQRKNRGEDSGKGVEMLQQQIVESRNLMVQEQHLASVSDQPSSGLSFAINISLGTNIPSVSGDTPVFLVVRGDDGSNIPVAVKRKRFADLPLSISISDQDAMMPQRTVSQMNSLSFQARLSISGKAKPETGDWVSNTITIPVKAETPVELIIDQPVK